MKYWLSIPLLIATLLVAIFKPAQAQAEPGFVVHSQLFIPFVAKSSAPAQAPTPSFADQVVVLVNDERARAGCGPVRQSLQLASASQRHSSDMASHDFFSHTGSDQSSPSSRAMAVGYFSPIGENIAAGQSTPESVFAAWMSSPGHRANILNCSYKSMGVSYTYDPDDTFGPYRHYWTQDFGTQ